MKRAIYATKGRAKEFCDLALNHYAGCGHGCAYCYGAVVTHVDRQKFYEEPHARLTIGEIDQSIRAWGGDKATVLMSFVTDPYQPIDEEAQLTRAAIIALHRHGFPVTILTKAGPLAQRDFDLLDPATDTFATTLTCVSIRQSLEWEPHAGKPDQRINNLREAKRHGLTTWASLEPVISPESTKELVKAAAPWVDLFKVGTMNYHPHGKTIDWRQYGYEMVDLLQGLRKPYYLKDDLRRAMGIMPAVRGSGQA